MLHLVQSDKMEVLAEALIRALQSMPGDLFTPRKVVVQSPGMAQWLKLQIAQRCGIATNIDFPLPSTYIWQQYQALLPDLPDESAFTKDNMQWKLMTLLSTLGSRQCYALLHDYLKDGQAGDGLLRRYQLAGKIADLFDQYLMYRPHWLAHWQSGEDDLPHKNTTLKNPYPWQASLWRALVAHTEALGESPWHRGNLHQALLEAIAIQGESPRAPLFIFGISALAPQQLEVFAALAQHQEVYIFWCNPSRHYWGDIENSQSLGKKHLAALSGYPEAEALMALFDIGNPLLAAWGKLGRDYQELLLAHEPAQQEFFAELTPTHLLSHLQTEISELTHRGVHQPLTPEALLGLDDSVPKIVIDDQDTSLQIRGCHGKLREVEVLFDYLLSRFDADASLTPADVVVMVPDVAEYAPYIQSVFASQPPGRRLPFAIADQTLADESSLLSSFVALMSVHQSRLTLDEVLALLEVPAIMARFEVSHQEFETLSLWLKYANVRWALDGQDKDRWQLPQDSQNTLLFGLKRLLAGYASSELLIGKDDPIAPYTELEGQQVVALGKLYEFVQALGQLIAGASQPMVLAEKVVWAREQLSAFFLPQDEDLAHINALQQGLDRLNCHQHQYAEALNQDIFVDALKAQLQQSGVGQRFLAGSINFCTLMPMRAVPFKQVCLLGMNEQDYPRRVMPMGFDLIQESPPMRGDRSRRLDDRYLFLEAVLSARDGLYISYQSRSAKDNSERLPSMLVSELLEYCLETYCLGEGEEYQQRQQLQALLVRHEALQPYNPVYYRTDTATQSFDSRWCEVAAAKYSPGFGFCRSMASSQYRDLPDSIQPDELVGFFQRPIERFVRSQWHIRLEKPEKQQTQFEPYKLEGLSRYKAMELWLQQGSAGTTRVRNTLAARGELPPAGLAGQSLNALHQRIEPLLAYMQQITAGKAPDAAHINFPHPQVRLEGHINAIYAGRLVLSRPGVIRPKDELALWLQLLMATVGGSAPVGGLFVGLDGNKKRVQCFELPPVAPDAARAHLDALLTLWGQGQQAPLPFACDSAHALVFSQDEAKALHCFYGDGGKFSQPEVDDPYIALVLPSLSDRWNQFSELSHAIFGPMMRHQQDNA